MKHRDAKMLDLPHKAYRVFSPSFFLFFFERDGTFTLRQHGPFALLNWRFEKHHLKAALTYCYHIQIQSAYDEKVFC